MWLSASRVVQNDVLRFFICDTLYKKGIFVDQQEIEK